MTNLKVICITGPESSGKTTLSAELSKHLNAILVPEYSREHLNSLANPSQYLKSDLIIIAQKQLTNLEVALKKNQNVVMDTGVEVVKIWHEEKFGFSAELDDLLNLQQELISSYVLCSPDILWEPDPLRENPTDRDRLFELYKGLLENQPIKYMAVSGSIPNRLKSLKEFTS